MKKFIAILVILVMMVPCVALAEVYPPEVVVAACLKEFTTEPQMTVEKLPFDPKDNTEYTILAWDKDTEVCTIALPNDGVYVITTDGYSAFIIAGYIMWQKCPARTYGITWAVAIDGELLDSDTFTMYGRMFKAMVEGK